MELLLAASIGITAGCGVFLTLRARTFSVVLGLALISYATNLFLFVMGRPVVGAPPIAQTGSEVADPIPQALVLTAIVIGLAMTAFFIVLAIKANRELGSDAVDAEVHS